MSLLSSSAFTTVAADDIKTKVKIGGIFVLVPLANVTQIELSVKFLVTSSNPTGSWRLFVNSALPQVTIKTLHREVHWLPFYCPF